MRWIWNKKRNLTSEKKLDNFNQSYNYFRYNKGCYLQYPKPSSEDSPVRVQKLLFQNSNTVTLIWNQSSVESFSNSITKSIIKLTLTTLTMLLINLNVIFHLNTEAKSNFDYNKMAGLTQTIKFNLGGHINHSIYWENLAPIGRGGG